MNDTNTREKFVELFVLRVGESGPARVAARPISWWGETRSSPRILALKSYGSTESRPTHERSGSFE